ncbi:MAG: energy-coupling factor transporter transmembrane protein EcfT [Coriobacteriaceae bacterium]|nr:energy-coupling factor transporter transmembrane protein EcfT [Coriobacteriaceae bacterium]
MVERVSSKSSKARPKGGAKRSIAIMLDMVNSTEQIAPGQETGRARSLTVGHRGGARRRPSEADPRAAEQHACALPPRRLDPRVSLAILVLINASAFAPRLIVGQVAIVVLAAAVAVWCGRIASAVRWCAAYAIVMVAGYAFLLLPNGVAASFATMLVMARCVFCAWMFASTMIATTRVGELACALQRTHLPRHGVIAICVTLRFFPTMAGEFRSVIEALRVRGMALTPRTVVAHPVRVMENLLVPVMSRLSIVADELANAAVVRGMDSSRPRTSYYDLRLSAVDVVFLTLFAVVAAALVLSKFGVIA